MGTARAEQWAATMRGHDVGDIRLAHRDSAPQLRPTAPVVRELREQRERDSLSEGATLAQGAGNRASVEAPDVFRTCFERDRDRILHEATAFRRLAGKTQVFIFPHDHQRTRLTHALEVAQVATAIAAGVGANVSLCEAIALGHDCGHGPGGHASEDAFSPYLVEGYNHAVWGADVVLAPLNLCVETLDGIRNHSWSRPAPGTIEGEIVSWADRIAYVCHDFEDACHVGIVSPAMLPEELAQAVGTNRRAQLHTFITAMVDTAIHHGVIGMDAASADSLSAFRRFNYSNIYMRPASQTQAEVVIRVLRALVEYFADCPNTLQLNETSDQRYRARVSGNEPLVAGSAEALRAAVTYVAGMTDKYAFDQATTHLGWRSSDLPIGVG